jgi:formate dehydrogenase subunit gamma
MVAPALVERYGLRERLVHAVAGLSFVYLLLTGLAFWTPALYWLTAITGGGFLARALHPWAGLVFAAAVVAMFAGWRRDMRITPGDREWRRAMAAYIRNEDADVPPVGRFNYGQKMLFWVMAWGGAALLLSGLVMWAVGSLPWELRGLGYAATLVHAVAALVTIGAFIVHVYMGIAVVPGGLRAVVQGGVSEEWLRRHHALWLAELRGVAANRVPAGIEDRPAPASGRVTHGG